jgi:hypothetical protein
MKSFKDLLEESTDLVKMSKKEFDDSGDATDFMESIQSLLDSKALKAWSKVTDTNYGTKTKASLKNAQVAYGKFLDEMYSAE